jgi:alpha-beta hydrolase superfamily lysophospholipase
VVPSLVGVANAATPQWRHAPEAIRATTAGVPNPLVLVGHSGGGLLLPTIAAGLTVEVAALIFVDSFLPPAGGSVPLAPPGFIDKLRALATDGLLPRWSSWFGETAWRELVPDDRLRATLEAEMPAPAALLLPGQHPTAARLGRTPVRLPPPDRQAIRPKRRRCPRRGWPVAEIPRPSTW